VCHVLRIESQVSFDKHVGLFSHVYGCCLFFHSLQLVSAGGEQIQNAVKMHTRLVVRFLRRKSRLQRNLAIFHEAGCPLHQALDIIRS